MNSANHVDEQIKQLKAGGIPLADAAWKVAMLTVGWPYVFAARGQYCTPTNRRASYRADHPTIKSKCKNYKGKGSCSGCKWYPGGEKVRFFDCRGYTYWILLKIYDWKLQGAGATSQWNTASNWSAKGTIDTVPADQLVCLFQKSKIKKASMAHTGLGYKGQTVECSSGVQHSKTINKKWTHWALPKCVDREPAPDPPPVPPLPPEPEPPQPKPVKRPTIRRGSKGEAVKECQQMLIKLGYSVGKKGADGIYGLKTRAAVCRFQKDHKLKADGITGEKTWGALQKATAAAV